MLSLEPEQHGGQARAAKGLATAASKGDRQLVALQLRRLGIEPWHELGPEEREACTELSAWQQGLRGWQHLNVLAATVTGFNPCAGNFNFERVEEIEAQITAYREEEFLPGVDAIQARAVASAEAAAERASAEAAAERAATEAAAGPAGTAEEPAV